MKRIILTLLCLTLATAPALAGFEIGLSGGVGIAMDGPYANDLNSPYSTSKLGIAAEARFGMSFGKFTVGLLSGYLPVSKATDSGIQYTHSLIPALAFGRFKLSPYYLIVGAGLYNSMLSSDPGNTSHSAEFGLMGGSGYSFDIGPVSIDFGARAHLIMFSGAMMKNFSVLLGADYRF